MYGWSSYPRLHQFQPMDDETWGHLAQKMKEMNDDARAKYPDVDFLPFPEKPVREAFGCTICEQDLEDHREEPPEELIMQRLGPEVAPRLEGF